MQTHTGGCHCGAVRFEVETDLEKVISCNCSHCAMKGLVLTFVPASSFTLLKGGDNLSLYLFNTKRIEHHFCKTCSVEPFGRGTNQDGTPTVAVNVRCLDNIDIDALTITPVNGKDF